MSEQGAELLEPAAAPAGPVTATAQPVFCLIVDDEKSLRNLLARVLRQRMVMTEECGDAAEALRAIKNRTPDLVFLDVSLERSDAIEVIRGLGEMRFPGQIQLMSGRDLTLLHDVKRVGERHALKMLPPLQKPFASTSLRMFCAKPDCRAPRPTAVGRACSRRFAAGGSSSAISRRSSCARRSWSVPKVSRGSITRSTAC